MLEIILLLYIGNDFGTLLLFILTLYLMMT